MKNRKAKKGFTIIELVIVIAVIGILAAVLIPTFTGVIDKANAAADLEAARNAYTDYLVDHAEAGDMEQNLCIKSGTHYYHVVAGQFYAEDAPAYDTNATVKQANITNGALTVTETTLAVNHTHTTTTNDTTDGE